MRVRCTCGESACESELCDCDAVPCPVNHRAEAAEAERDALKAELDRVAKESDANWEVARAELADARTQYANLRKAFDDTLATLTMTSGELAEARAAIERVKTEAQHLVDTSTNPITNAAARRFLAALDAPRAAAAREENGS